VLYRLMPLLMTLSDLSGVISYVARFSSSVNLQGIATSAELIVAPVPRLHYAIVSLPVTSTRILNLFDVARPPSY